MDTGNGVAQHRTNSPGALNVKAGVKTREHDSRREHRMSREPPGYYFGKRVLLPECSESMALERRVPHMDSPPSGYINKAKGCWIFFLRKILYYVLYKTTTGASRTRRRNHPTSRLPIKSTGLEFELTKRTVPG